MSEPQVNDHTDEKSALKSEADRFALFAGRVVGTIALSAFAVRFLTIPWDFGGCFFQVWMSMVGTAGFMALLSRLKSMQRILTCCLLIPCLAICFFGPVYFAPQAFFPFFFLAAAIGAALWLWSQSINLAAILMALVLVLIGGCCGGSVKHMALLTRFRSLTGSALREIRFKPVAEGNQTIMVGEPKALARIAASLHSTSPYSPNHESVGKSWEMILVLADGPPIRCWVGCGNRSHPDTGCIQFDSAVYQNPELPRALAEAAGIRDFYP